MYYVLGDGGMKYGPATVDVLIQWAGEGRIQAGTMLQDESGMQVKAGDVPDLRPYLVSAAPDLEPQNPMGGVGQPQPGGFQTSQPTSPYSQPTQPNPMQTPGYGQPSSPYGNANNPSPYVRAPGYNYGGEEARKTATTGWIWLCAGFLCCFFFHIPAFIYGKKADQMGETQGKIIMWISGILLALGFLGTVGWIILAALTGGFS